MNFTQYAVACIFALPFLTLGAPLLPIPNDASLLDGRDPKFVTNLNHFLSTSSHAPLSAAKPTRAVDAGSDIERRNPKGGKMTEEVPLWVKTGPRIFTIDGFTVGGSSRGAASGKGGGKGPNVVGPQKASSVLKDKKGKQDVGAGEVLEARLIKAAPTRRPKPNLCKL
jgi:hypothetical protein